MDNYGAEYYAVPPAAYNYDSNLPHNATRTATASPSQYYPNNYGSLKPRQFEYRHTNFPPEVGHDKQNFDDDHQFTQSHSRRQSASACSTGGQESSISPNFYYNNYNYGSNPPASAGISAHAQEINIQNHRNASASAHPPPVRFPHQPSAAVIRQLRDKFQLVDNNGAGGDIPATVPAECSIIQDPHRQGQTDKTPPSYGSLLPNHNRGVAQAQARNSDPGAGPEEPMPWLNWLQGRLPFLILIILLLLCLFLALSGALVYFKYVPSARLRHISPEDEPCESTQCAFGATCRVESGRATCRCPEHCASEYTPVCGYDDVTYGNECLLRKYMCQHQKIVQIRHSGECNEPDPCEDKACLYGSICVPSTNGLYATCECPTSCPSYGDSEESQPVCGSDGQIHKNKCEMNRMACRLGRTITVKYIGKCDPCESISCLPPQVCQLDENRRPSCHCGDVCGTDFNPVCGSDGKTYSNECMMRGESCRSRRDIRIIYRGKCSSGVNPCESRTCRGYESCAINRFGIAQCTCAMICDPIIQPVCGSDGKTYDNECQLTLSSCRDSKALTVAYKGICAIGSRCTTHNCTPGATCSERNGEAICECPKCGADYDPVCGNDGVSYQNICHLQLEACSAAVSRVPPTQVLHWAHTGLCNGCEKRVCEFYSICILEPDGARCECPDECTTASLLTSGHVCGTDGQTYDNECDLQKSSCALRKSISVASRGHCDECANVHCKFGAKCESGICVCPEECPAGREVVCGSNLVTYTNECELRKAACRLGRTLNVHFYGDCKEGLGPFAPLGAQSSSAEIERNLSGFPPILPASTVVTPRPTNQCESIRCDFDALCELDEEGFPRCTCQFNCSSTKPNPICASDLKLYKNECEMQREACQRQTELRPRPMELCEDIEIKPCYGDEPLKNEDSGIEISCGNGPSRVNCPQGSFCHRTSSFAKCCKKNPEGRVASTTGKPGTVEEGGELTLTNCRDSAFGCCEDEMTAALGANYEGCPPVCQCNKLGAATGACDPVTHHCLCRPGVGGEMCDRCLPGFWGLSRISIHQEGGGCMACKCSKFGSVRDDCEQMTGRCVCKAGVLGHKCDSCSEGEFLGPLGCTIDSTNVVRTCDEVECAFGARCEQDGNRAGCACSILCDSKFDVQEVCGNDGFTYQSECHVLLQSCRSQTEILVAKRGSCSESSEPMGTASPGLRKWTALQNTEPGDDMLELYDMRNETETGNNGNWGREREGSDVVSSAMKSTRHLPPMNQFHANNFYKRVPLGHSLRFPTSATIQIRSYLGDICQGNSECVSAQSVCRNSRCVCRENFYEDAERIQCKPVHSHLPGITTCSKILCDISATCFDHFNGSYTCACPLHTSNANGMGCLENEQPVPFFTGKSRMILGKLAGYHKLSIEVEITPYLDFAHGVIIFSSQHANATGDFLSLALIDGFVEFRYDLGDGPIILKSANRMVSGSTNYIVAKRYNKDGLLRINDEEDIVGTSPGSMKSLNLENGGFIGHVPLNSTRIWDLVGTSNGFIGCLHKLKVGRRQIEFQENKDPLIRSIQQVYQCPLKTAPVKKTYTSHFMTTTPYYTIDEFAIDEDEKNEIIPVLLTTTTTVSSLEKFSGQRFPTTIGTHRIPCSKKMCRHNGECWIDESTKAGYKCMCPPSYSGKICETYDAKVVESGAVLDFRGFSYLELPKIETGARQLAIEIWFMLRSRNGLLFYSGQERGKGDCVAIIIKNAHIQFLFDLGSGMANLTWDKPISLHKWHWIIASRVGREGSLQIDGQMPQTAKSPPALSELNLELPVYIGGMRDVYLLHRELGLPRPFDGAIQYIRINGETYHRDITDALRRRLVHRNEGPPCGASMSPPCQHNGVCYPRLDSFACVCPTQFTGKTCEIRKTISGPIRFDGQNFLKFPRKIAKHESQSLTEYDELSDENFDSDLDELFAEFESTRSIGYNYDLDTEVEGTTPVSFIESSTDEDLESSGRRRANNKAQRRNRLEIVFRTISNTSGVIFWTGREYNVEVKRGYLGLFISNGTLELRIDLGSPKSKKPVILRSKLNLTDGRWHQVLIARRRRLIVFQVDGATPQRATSPIGSNVLFSDGKIWIGGVAPSVLHSEVPPGYHQGFIGCLDLIRIEKRRLPLSRVAQDNGFAFCDDD